ALAELVGADGARTLLLYTFGQAQSAQTHRQAAAFAALADPSRVSADAEAEAEADLDASFDRGVEIILAGIDSLR
ncbi:TetR/AcrR family transcriptional regulator, partial [Leucobacter soli]